MDKEINITITNYMKKVRRKYADIEKAFLFGSFAKGIANCDSDIDVALIFKSLEDSKRFDLQVKLMLLASEIDSRIEPHPIFHEVFYADSSFVIEIQKTGIEIKE